ncbi:MAG: FtsX-like permease family protein [Saccharofermentans sp.]|nr:FtsX-like permease family protein [Saccharofermentans sp.]
MSPKETVCISLPKTASQDGIKEGFKMNPIVKTTLKNIFGKPFRTLLVVFSIFVCSLAAVLCFDLGSAEKKLFVDLFTKVYGSADFYVTKYNIVLPEDMPEHVTLSMYGFSETYYDNVEGEYYVAKADKVHVAGFEPDKAFEMGLCEELSIADGEVIITSDLAEKRDYAVGDTIILHDASNDGHEFTVTKIVESDPKSILFRGCSCAVNLNGASVLSCGRSYPNLFFIDIKDDADITEAQNILNREFGEDAVQFLGIDATTQQILNQTMGLLFLLFAITFLLVVFVTFSVCERIVSERMSFVGTLRSLGASNKKTCFILLCENIFYALAGSVPAVILYSIIRNPLITSITMVSVSGENIEQEVPMLSPVLIAGVIIGAVLVECLIPLNAQLKALHTSIRDIIFDNRDTEYKLNNKRSIAGFILTLISLLCFFGRSNIFVASICIFTGVIGLALLMPLILKKVSDLVFKLARRLGDESMALAARESSARKSTVSSAVLCATSVTLCVIVYTLGMSFAVLMDTSIYDCDVIAICMDKEKYFTYIDDLEGVTQTETIYAEMDSVFVGEAEIYTQVFGYPEGGYELYRGLSGLPDKIESGTVYLENSWANRNGYSVGDTIKYTFDPYGVFPIEKTFTVAGFFKIANSDALQNNICISEKDYHDVFHSLVDRILIRCEDPDAVSGLVGKYSAGVIGDVQTYDEYAAENEASNRSSRMIFSTIIIAALGMTFVGMVSNQLIGFVGRKKECAIMIATSMSKKKLIGVLTKEMLIASIAASLTGAIAGTYLIYIVAYAVASSDAISLTINVHPLFNLIFCLAIIPVFALTVLFPVKHLRKIRISEELKYE